jgi:phage tail protein X
LHRPGRILFTAVHCLFLGFLVIHVGFHVPTVAAQSPHKAKLVSVGHATNATLKPTEVITPTLVAPAGSTLYIAKRGDAIATVSHHFIAQTSYLTSSELTEAIRQANGGLQGTFLKAGQQIIIPGILDAPIVEKSIPVAKDFEVRAIYLTGLMAGSDHGLRIVKRWKEVGGNAVVFDVKDSDGTINIAFENSLAGAHKTYIHDLPKYVRFLHSQGMHAIARVAIFRDERLVVTHPELAVQSHKTGSAWKENGKLVWTDPSQPKVQEYDIALARKAAEAGADEIQFDYVRFPAEGDQKDASFYFQTQHPDWKRADVIADFLKRAYGELHPT